MHRNFLLYFLGRALPSACGLLLIVFYTRLLSPEEYGRYTFIVAVIFFGNALFYHWIRIALLRFSLKGAGNRKVKRIAAKAFVLSSLISLAYTAPICLVSLGDYSLPTLLLIPLLLMLHAWFETHLELLRASIRPLEYSAMNLTKSLLGLLLGTLLVYWGYGVAGALVGLFGSLAAIAAISIFRHWRPREVLRGISGTAIRHIFLLTFPMSCGVVFTFFIIWLDRSLLIYFHGEQANGLFSAVHDLTRFSMNVIFVSVQLVGFPLAINAFRKHGLDRSNEQLNLNLDQLLLFSIPMFFGIVALRREICFVLLGPEFAAFGASLISLVAVSSFLEQLKSQYVDIRFLIQKKPREFFKAFLVLVLVALVCKPLFISRWAGLGAALSTIAMHALGLGISFAFLGARLGLRLDLRRTAAYLLAAGAMYATIQALPGGGGAVRLGLLVAAGAAAYFGTLALLFISNRQARKRTRCR
ncbi:lipopolysaccharide biosynthesis protein [Paucidesulfovibrio longus]|uniref:lipopolysaccharide biosynthesis protein n=1 Tax=Paucidesulfovibrio longus TaxID=889 RepID=UPI0012DD9D38|nr:oligosaccharide flippase family protein [Paucidesulfovibrio longus]